LVTSKYTEVMLCTDDEVFDLSWHARKKDQMVYLGSVSRLEICKFSWTSALEPQAEYKRSTLGHRSVTEFGGDGQSVAGRAPWWSGPSRVNNKKASYGYK
jgi:hypothetical protein